MKIFVLILLSFSIGTCLRGQSSGDALPARAIANSAAVREPLPAGVLSQIARMTFLFDAKTLNGWIQAPPAPLLFSGNDVHDPAAIAHKLQEKTDPVSQFIYEHLDAVTRNVLSVDAWSPARLKESTSILVKALNRTVGGSALYGKTLFAGIRLRPSTKALLHQNPQGQELMRLNRLLLEDAYPDDIIMSPSTSWSVQEGTLASTGAGRGVLYTEKDYGHYRIIFNLRHVTGSPDHKPCILFFCTRPAEASQGLDALGGIQFQMPNGGHWDYRPGHNSGGIGFTNPSKTTFDYHAWQQVEILIDAKNGTARMAVAEPVGTYGIENIRFTDPTAGRVGPIALQMHNSGLFDEYRDIRIEVDPAEDRLITVK